MRPVRRGRSPRPDDFAPYTEAKPELISRVGGYCSYCERRIAANLAVEHIQPKKLSAYRHLEGRWENFLLGCVNCNSTKSKKDVPLDHILLPDRDNTFLAFTYSPDGTVSPSAAADNRGITRQAEDTLALTGLDKRSSAVLDENGRRVSIDRVAQRLEVWAVAEEASADLSKQPDNEAIRRGLVRTALGYGFFSLPRTYRWEGASRDAAGATSDRCGASLSPGGRGAFCTHLKNYHYPLMDPDLYK